MPIITNLKRLGRFQVHIGIIEKADQNQLKSLFGRIIITRAEMILHSGCIDYVGICDDFELVRPGESMPFYEWTNDRGKWIAKRVEEKFYNADKTK